MGALPNYLWIPTNYSRCFSSFCPRWVFTRPFYWEGVTPLKLNLDTHNGHIWKEIHVPKRHFRCRMYFLPFIFCIFCHEVSMQKVNPKVADFLQNMNKILGGTSRCMGFFLWLVTQYLYHDWPKDHEIKVYPLIFLLNTADASEILLRLIGSLSHLAHYYLHIPGGAGFLPSTVWFREQVFQHFDPYGKKCSLKHSKTADQMFWEVCGKLQIRYCLNSEEARCCWWKKSCNS